jgi:hypothetical protein
LVVALSMNSRKVWIEGCALGVLLSLLSVALLSISDTTLFGAYTLVVLLASASLTSSQRNGAFFGLFAMIAESVTDFIYYVLGSGVDPLLVPYAVGLVLFIGRIPVFPLAGAVGGYLGERYFAEKTKPKARVPVRTSVARKRRGKQESREDQGKNGEKRVAD